MRSALFLALQIFPVRLNAFKMNPDYRKAGGYALISGSVLLILTMGLHPAGGSFEHLKKITAVNVTAHSLAILSILFLLFGFWAFRKIFITETVLSTAAFITIATGLAAGLLAAAVNGLALPVFIGRYENPSPAELEIIRHILRYNFALNHAFDFILLGAACISLLLWSTLVLRTKLLNRWLAYYGIFLNVVFVSFLIYGFVFVDLHGFRVFVFGLVSWIVAAGYLLVKAKH
jgi:hypothetical protein